MFSNDKLLINQAKKILKNTDDKYHDIKHTRSVLRNTKQILKSYPNADRRAIIIAVWWHDVGRAYQNKGHERLSAELISKELTKLNYDKKFIKTVFDAIEFHMWKGSPTTLEGIILRDADKLDLINQNRWKRIIKCNQLEHINGTRAHESVLKNEVLQLPETKKLYDKRFPKFKKFHDNLDSKFKL